MTNNANTSANTRNRETIERIAINQRTGVWRVTLNGRFYGDYGGKHWALESAFAKADAIAASGGAATITWTIDGDQDALLYDTRRPKPRQKLKRDMAPKRVWNWPHIFWSGRSAPLGAEPELIRAMVSSTP